MPSVRVLLSLLANDNAVILFLIESKKGMEFILSIKLNRLTAHLGAMVSCSFTGKEAEREGAKGASYKMLVSFFWYKPYMRGICKASLEI